MATETSERKTFKNRWKNWSKYYDRQKIWAVIAPLDPLLRGPWTAGNEEQYTLSNIHYTLKLLLLSLRSSLKQMLVKDRKVTL